MNEARESKKVYAEGLNNEVRSKEARSNEYMS